MKYQTALSSAVLFCLINACNSQVKVKDTAKAPKVTEADHKYADVFKPLDGTWKGKFEIYEDEARAKKGKRDLKKLTINDIQKSNLKLINTIDVKQIYTSESPFFQRVTITDFYPSSGKEATSSGVNKIQDGVMWCVVKKPEELVIHQGLTEGTTTIIWYSENEEKSEYFRETVSPQFYEIIGWGYYGNDNRNMTPQLWFYGKYEKQ
jgi:hypothetical protein